MRVHLPVQGTRSLKRSRFPVGTADIPALVNQAPLLVARLLFRLKKRDFGEAKQKLEVLRGTEGGGLRGSGERRETDACLYIMHK